MASTNKKVVKTFSSEFIGESNVKRPKLTAAEIAKIQKPFTDKLKLEMEKNGHSLSDLPKILDMPYSYLVSIKNGLRRISRAEKTTIQKFADYMGVGAFQIVLWGGEWDPIDFVAIRNLEDGLKSAYLSMRTDPILMTCIPSEDIWDNPEKDPNAMKLFAVNMYEILREQLFLKHANLDLDKDSEKVFRNFIKSL